MIYALVHFLGPVVCAFGGNPLFFIQKKVGTHLLSRARKQETTHPKRPHLAGAVVFAGRLRWEYKQPTLWACGLMNCDLVTVMNSIL